jgi:hypothetical protein
MNGELAALLPRHKQDFERANAVVAMGYPAVAGVLPELMTWLQDYNWPIARIIAPFLASIGRPVLPEIRRVLDSTDDIWKYWVLTYVVEELEADVIAELRPELQRLALRPTPGEVEEEVDQKAQELLDRLPTSVGR